MAEVTSPHLKRAREDIGWCYNNTQHLSSPSQILEVYAHRVASAIEAAVEEALKNENTDNRVKAAQRYGESSGFRAGFERGTADKEAELAIREEKIKSMFQYIDGRLEREREIGRIEMRELMECGCQRACWEVDHWILEYRGTLGRMMPAHCAACASKKKELESLRRFIVDRLKAKGNTIAAMTVEAMTMPDSAALEVKDAQGTPS